MLSLGVVGIGAGGAGGAEVIEIGEGNVGDLPGGKEADGIIGDFVLRNDLVEAVVSGDLPLRRANMSTFYGADGITPGCLYDLTLRGSDNDQLTAFCPLDQRGAVTYVRALPDQAAVEVMVSAALDGAVTRRHVYSVRDGIAGVFVTSEILSSGEGAQTLEVKGDRHVRFREEGKIDGITWMDANDPAARGAYAYAELGDPLPESVELRPDQPLRYERVIAVGTSPGEAWGRVAAIRGESATLSGIVRDAQGAGVGGATVHVRMLAEAGTEAGAEAADGILLPPLYPDSEGRFQMEVPEGKRYACVAAAPGRGESPPVQQALLAEEGVAVELVLGEKSAIAIQAGMPCKAQFIGVGGTPPPDLGPPERAHGCVDQFHSESGDFRVALPPGRYRVIVTRGIEFSHLDQEVTVAEGETAVVEARLERVVDTPGWVSTDFHNHSTPSGDNICATDDRIINLAAEHIEFAPTTEHNRLYDWTPHIERLGLSAELSTVSGMELTGSGPHLNAFPLEPVPYRQDGGAPVWNRDPRINAITLRDFQGGDPDRWVHLNHPDMVENFVDRDQDGVADGGFAYLGGMLDAMETENFTGQDILHGAPFLMSEPFGARSRITFVRPFIWLQLLNQGVRVPAIAVADAHSVHGNGVGGWRTYVRSSTDDPAEIDWREMVRNAKAGQSLLTTGPFLEVLARAGEREAGPGGSMPAGGDGITLDVRVQCNTWTDIDRVQILVNGRQIPELNFTRATSPEMFAPASEALRFSQSIPVGLDEDALIVVVAAGEGSDLSVGYGTSTQARLRPLAYHNPIEIDLGGDGFTPNGDTLGFDLPVGGLTPDHVRAVLGGRN
ncbi:hypothetical protein BH23VER1_BH23VER1_16710 [soil metagenome]